MPHTGPVCEHTTLCLHTLLRFAMNNVASFATINNIVIITKCPEDRF